MKAAIYLHRNTAKADMELMSPAAEVYAKSNGYTVTAVYADGWLDHPNVHPRPQRTGWPTRSHRMALSQGTPRWLEKSYEKYSRHGRPRIERRSTKPQ